MVGFSRSVNGFPEIQSLIAMYGPDGFFVVRDVDASAPILPFNVNFSGIFRTNDCLAIRSPIECPPSVQLFVLFFRAFEFRIT